MLLRIPRPQIVSGSRDRTIKLWNTLGECKYTIAEPDGHTDWVSCVRFSPVTANPIIVSAGWDKSIKVRALSRCLSCCTLLLPPHACWAATCPSLCPAWRPALLTALPTCLSFPWRLIAPPDT